MDFKRVTVFIGPTGGGKSTLAKLAAIFFGGYVKITDSVLNIDDGLIRYNIYSYKGKSSFINWKKASGDSFVIDKPVSIEIEMNNSTVNKEASEGIINDLVKRFAQQNGFEGIIEKALRDVLINQMIAPHLNARLSGGAIPYAVNYTPTERVFVPSIEYSWAGLMRDDIGLPKLLLEFANSFSISRKEVPELEISFLNVTYLHVDGRDFIKIPEREEPLMLLETASGIQSVTPLLVLLEQIHG